MAKKEMRTILLAALLLFVPILQIAAATSDSPTSGADTYYEKGQTAQRHQLTRRMALVGAAGIDVSVVKGLEIYYAFVGDGEYTLTKTRIHDVLMPTILETQGALIEIKKGLEPITKLAVK